ncbi:hypothetical protein [Bacillus mycoides]|uniref:Phage protein n=1 Tax=Bacillus mycoides (strain KBAB4) TaxID=315730 RepID=A9VS66_BACMK|nr:hypothetical protein [Bacillus mycoides]ABY44766.1 phage protein [Bacillus mycoides KBAB4]
MQLTKLEKISVVTSILVAIGEDVFAKHVDMQRLEEEFGELVSNSTEKDCGKATLSVLNKMIDSLLEGNQLVENNETIQNQTTEA